MVCFLQVDEFELAVETPVPATPQQRRNADTPEEVAAPGHQPCIVIQVEREQCAQPQAERTNAWVAQLPEPASDDVDDSSAELDASGAVPEDLAQDATEEGGPFRL